MVFGVLGTIVAITELSKSNKDRINTSQPFNSFKNNYLVVYSLMMGDYLPLPFVAFKSVVLVPTLCLIVLFL